MADTPTQPQLGYGNRSETSIDSVNQWMRAQPWYQEQLAKWGQSPNNVHLTDPEKQDIIKLAQANGVVVDEGHNGQELDDSGNFQAKSHKLRNTMIVAGIAGAALLTAGLAGAFAGPAVGAAAGAEGAADAGAVGLGTGVGLEGAGAGLAGVEGGAAGLDAAGVASLGTGAMGAVPVGSTLGAVGAAAGGDAVASTAGGMLPATTTAAGSAALPAGLDASGAVGDATGGAANGAFDADGNFVGDTTVDGQDPSSLGGSSLGKTLGKALGTFAPLAGSVGQAIGKANTAAGQNRLNQETLGLTANGQNINGQSAFEQELLNRAKEEDVQRKNSLKDVYRASYNANPRVSPFDPAGAPVYSKQYTSVAQALADQGQTALANPAKYSVATAPDLQPYKPISPADVQGATNTQQGTASKIADYLGPGLSVAQLIAKGIWS